MRRMSAQRRKVVVMASSMAAMSGVMPVLLRGHRYGLMVWVGAMVLWFGLVMREMVKLRREDGDKCHARLLTDDSGSAGGSK